VPLLALQPRRAVAFRNALQQCSHGGRLRRCASKIRFSFLCQLFELGAYFYFALNFSRQVKSSESIRSSIRIDSAMIRLVCCGGSVQGRNFATPSDRLRFVQRRSTYRFEQFFGSQIEIDDNSIPVNILTVLHPSEQNTSANQCKQKKISLEKFTYFESKLLCTTPDKED
jgi:hypothetical protein